MKVESRSIEYIPAEERHGKARDLFPIWFGANMHITTLVTGALPIALGLNLFWSLIAIIVGTLLGAIFMASHSAQGPQLGIPQMIQSRAQFGIIGAIFPLFLVMFVYLGFFASSGLLAAQTLSSLTSMDQTWSILILNIMCFIVTIFGYNLIHKMQKLLSWTSLLVYLVATVIIVQLPFPAGSLEMGSVQLPVFLLAVSMVATWQLAYAPYVADYSRYLPVTTPTAQTFWYSYFGTAIGTIWMMALGAALTIAIPNFLEHSGGNLAHLFGGFAIIMYLIIIFGQLAINVFNLYGAFMSTITTIEPFMKLKVTAKVRIGMIFGVTVIGTILCLLGQSNFLSFFLNFIFFISYFLIPWTSINLVDYYLLRHGRYNVKDIFDLNGQYGKINWITCIAFLVSILVEIPFINTSFYVGPVAKAFNGADIAWVIGLVVPAGLYYFPMRKKLNTADSLFETQNRAL
ncbi:purine-cytosine permease family protein [Neobacillus vireti]|uniref:Purine-cytosine permease n=1 Tax=Neobacillus vireti LMG 21834 TaxID=1131730 RepID=A0AB94IGK0_9BACI|nr:cytosine permease [Neobacillus vireti]ETI66238.1 putative purine-cytosine permease [Neobacillus vireti LMG 21834]KLT19953.1 sulfonate ABC transporter substrate-binding protein [Neobacillus vireti]